MLLVIIIIVNNVIAAPQVIDKIAAVVNNSIILESEIYSLIQSVKLSANRKGQHLPDDVTLRNKILEHLILDQIVLQIGYKIGIKITNKSIDRAIAKIAKHNNITIDDMLKRLFDDGISYNVYRNNIRKEMIISKVINNAVINRFNILPQEVDALTQQINNYNNNITEFKLSYILIELPKNYTSDQIIKMKNKAQFIVNQAQKGIDFNKIKITFFNDKQVLQTKQIGWTSIQKLPLVFSKSLSIAKKGDIIGPIHSTTGFYILKVDDLRIRGHDIFVTEVYARHILLKPSPILNDIEAYTQLQKIALDIKNGKISFDNAAKQFSQDPTSANQGGKLEWIALSDIYDPVFRNTLMKLNKGQISPPIHSSAGWHLIKLIDTRRVNKTNIAKKEFAYRILFNRKFYEEASIWMQEQRLRTYIKVLD